MTTPPEVSESDEVIPATEPETPAERFRQLRDDGVKEEIAFRQILTEPKWWDTHRTRQVEAAMLAHDDAGITCLASLNAGKATGEIEYVRLTGDRDKRCLFNPYSMMRIVPRFSLSHADACAKVMKIPRNSPDRHGALYLKALDTALNGQYSSGDTHADYATVTRELGKIAAGETINLESVIADLESAGLIMTFDIPPREGI